MKIKYLSRDGETEVEEKIINADFYKFKRRKTGRLIQFTICTRSPVTPEYLSAKGLALLVNNINKIKKRTNHDIKIDGVLVTMLNQRTNLSKEMLKALDESVEFVKSKFNLDMKIFESKIPISVKIGEAILNKKSIIEYDPKNKVSEAYQYFAWEWSEI